MLKRPKPGEDEEDILRMQAEYLTERSKNNTFEPAAKVINLRDANVPKSSSCTRKPSKYATAKGLKKNVTFQNPNHTLVGDIVEKNADEHNTDAEVMCEDDNVYYPHIKPSILGDIVQKNVDITDVTCMTPLKAGGGFPIASKFDGAVREGGQSVFSQHMAQTEHTTPMDVDNTNNNVTNMPDRSYIVTNEDAHSIHKQNVDTLSKMTQQEILEEQHKLLQTLNPDVVAFLKSKRTQPPAPHVTTEGVCVESAPEDTMEDILEENDVLSHPQVKKWFNFNSLEKDKLLWMAGIKESNQTTDQPYEARFNFEGYLQPYTRDYNEQSKPLYHHGDEPHRPGYSLTELFEFSRSTVTQQRVMALNTIAGILDYYFAGTYRGVIDIPLSKIFFVVRFAMDENTTIMLEPALRAMRSMLYNKIDEAALDGMVGFHEGNWQPCLDVDKDKIPQLSKESELKDFHVAEIDLVSAATRTDIVQRIYYILHTIKPSFLSVQYCLQILCRLARDHSTIVNALMSAKHLMKTIIEQFVPVTSVNFMFTPDIVYKGKPILAALKLLRVLTLASHDAATQFVREYHLVKTLFTYITSPIQTTYGVRIQTESLYILRYLVSSGVLHCDDLKDIEPFLLNALHNHIESTNVDGSVVACTHAAVLLQLMNALVQAGSVGEHTLLAHMCVLVRNGAHKWLTQLAACTTYQYAKTCLVAATLDCCRTLHNCATKDHHIGQIASALKAFLSSRGCNLLTRNLISSSNLLSNMNVSNTDENLMSLCTSVVDSEYRVLPMLNGTSSIPVILALVRTIDALMERPVLVNFMDLIWNYLNAFRTSTISLFANWFTRMEVDLLFSILKMCNSLKAYLGEVEKDTIYMVTHKWAYIARGDKVDDARYLFDNIIFNKDWFTADRLFNKISITDISDITSNMDVTKIKVCYNCIIPDIGEMGKCISLRVWQEPVLPRDWLYSIIQFLYEESEFKKPDRLQSAATDVRVEEYLTHSLHWIIFHEMCYPELLTDIDLTDRFCRVMCIFLCNNTSFLNKSIQSLLRTCILIIFNKQKTCEFNFDRPLLRWNNFQDFYTQCLEQFQAVSYGDHNFAACVLVPIAQKHDVKWRKLLWSEYAGCLRALNCPETLLCYDLDSYLTPPERDISLLMSYRDALNGNLLQINSIPFKIAMHHINLLNVKT